MVLDFVDCVLFDDICCANNFVEACSNTSKSSVSESCCSFMSVVQKCNGSEEGEGLVQQKLDLVEETNEEDEGDDDEIRSLT